MSLFVHPNVMPLIGLCFDEEMPLLIMPFMSKGSVLEYVKQNKVDLHKDLEASEVEVVTFLVYVYKSKPFLLEDVGVDVSKSVGTW